MEQYIKKSAVVAEIEKRQRTLDLDSPLGRGGMVELQVLKDKLDILEVKEVDLEKELQKLNKEIVNDNGFFNTLDIARHFFELGLRASNPFTWEDILKCIKDAMNYHLYAFRSADGQQKVYEEVLKRFKALKGEKV